MVAQYCGSCGCIIACDAGSREAVAAQVATVSHKVSELCTSWTNTLTRENPMQREAVGHRGAHFKYREQRSAYPKTDRGGYEGGDGLRTVALYFVRLPFDSISVVLV